MVLGKYVETQVSREWWNLWNYESTNLGSTISGEQMVEPVEWLNTSSTGGSTNALQRMHVQYMVACTHCMLVVDT
jgi:hypothetical protein